MRVLVLGLARTGEAVVRWALAAGHDVVVVEESLARDDLERGRRDRARTHGARVVEGAVDAPASLVEGVDLLVPSPGVRPIHPLLEAARAAGVTVRSEIDVAAEVAAARTTPPALVAVTGTNGKTTVTTVTAAMLAASGQRAVAAGNVGYPLLDAATDDVDVIVAEVSSFQLELTTAAFAPDVAVLLNVAEDHIDWHGSMEAYAAAKARVFAHQRSDAAAVVNVDDVHAAALTGAVRARLVGVSAGAPPDGGFGVRDGQVVGPDGPIAAVPSSHASHDVANAVAATAAATLAGATPAGVAAALAAGPPLDHRVQLVAEIDGVRYVDDSKATNPHATASALSGFDRVVLLAGGRNKGLDLSVLRDQRARLRAVVAIGEAAPEVEDAFRDAVPVTPATSMHEAVRAASRLAQRGDVVLLSPACASFDWYDGYAARGDDFSREVRSLAGAVSGEAS